jgi:hypothetical protein
LLQPQFLIWYAISLAKILWKPPIVVVDTYRNYRTSNLGWKWAIQKLIGR